jgi:8-oxo-dGTP diphosphatase
MTRTPVMAAGGIVTRRGTPLIAVVQLRKRNDWVLPKGKLDDGETPRAAAEREVLEETGHKVSVHEFLGTLAYEAGGRAKVVHYWRMEAQRAQTHELMNDVRAVAWLPLDQALERLSRSHEQAFLAQVGPLALEAAATRAAPPPRRPAAKRAAPVPRPVPTPAAKADAEQPVATRGADSAAPAVEPAEAIDETTETAIDQATDAAAATEAATTTDAAEAADITEAADVAEAGGVTEATDAAGATDVAEADSPALAPEPFGREYPVAPRSAVHTRSLVEKAWFWLRSRV